ncbi:MAG TPA: polyprenyl synthetase family protein, partial [Pyrinomonadaceae bacterium]|nr:polyprenyl synthetase family protein [Pyrinomonadaceae bacterium]
MQKFAPIREKLNPQTAARQIFGLIKREMALVEAEFERQASSNIQVINYLGDYLRASGGKRLRPALLLLSNLAVGGNASDESVIRLATVMEMLHTATLVHDDIIDNAVTRRNRVSVNARFGNQSAVLMGDWLYMSAFETSLRERSLEILDILTRLTRKMTEGELIQLTVLGRSDITENEYFDILQRKTAFLFSACCEIGAILGGAGPERQAALRDYGMNLGTAFQLANDVLDFTADEEILGKAAGADLLEGKLTLPLILLVARIPEYAETLDRIIVEGS